MSAAARVVRPGGHIIIASECRAGIPDGSGYEQLLRSPSSSAELLRSLSTGDSVTPGQWQVQIQLAVQTRATVHVRSDGLSDEQIRDARLEPCQDIEETLTHLISDRATRASVCLLPDGPMTIPTLDSRATDLS